MSMNFKGDLLELLQSKVISVADNIEFIVPQYSAPFVCTIRLNNICPGVDFVGNPASSKKEAEKSAAQRIMENPKVVNHIRQWNCPDILPSVSNGSQDTLAKGKLLEMFQKKGLPLDMVIFNVPQMVSPFQCTITIPQIFPTSEFVGFPCRTKKDAEKSAAVMILDNEQYVQAIWNWVPESRTNYNLSSDAMMAAKGKLLEILQKKGISTESVVFECDRVGNLFQCHLRFELVFGNQRFTGAPFPTKKDAEKSAAQVLLENADAMSRLCYWEPTRVDIKQEYIDSKYEAHNGRAMPLVQNDVQKSEAKGRLLELLQKKNIAVNSAVFTTQQNYTGLFECRLRVDNVVPFKDYFGGPCTTKKDAEKDAAYQFLQDPVAMQAFVGVEPFGKQPQQFLNLNMFGI